MRRNFERTARSDAQRSSVDRCQRKQLVDIAFCDLEDPTAERIYVAALPVQRTKMPFSLKYRRFPAPFLRRP
jgi:hypothetical protein